MKRQIVYGCSLLLAGCTSTPPPVCPPPVVQTQQVNVPVPQPCAALGKLGPEPAYVDTAAALKSAPDIFSVAKLLVAGRMQRVQRLAEYAQASAACSK